MPKSWASSRWPGSSAPATFSREPEWFTIAPIGALEKLLEKVGWTVASIDLFEINEAFAVVTMAAEHELEIPAEKVNIYGGAVALGHPIGCSGARVLVTLLNGLKRTGGQRGIACLCIGGGEAVALAVESRRKPESDDECGTFRRGADHDAPRDRTGQRRAVRLQPLHRFWSKYCASRPRTQCEALVRRHCKDLATRSDAAALARDGRPSLDSYMRTPAFLEAMQAQPQGDDRPQGIPGPDWSRTSAAAPAVPRSTTSAVCSSGCSIGQQTIPARSSGRIERPARSHRESKEVKTEYAPERPVIADRAARHVRNLNPS